MGEAMIQARNAIFFALIGSALVLAWMLGSGASAKIARLKVKDQDRHRLAGAAATGWLIASLAVIIIAILLVPDWIYSVLLGCLLAFLRLALALRFDLKFEKPMREDYRMLAQRGVKPMIAAVAFIPAAIVSRSLTAAVLIAALYLVADIAAERDEAQKKRTAGYLTVLVIPMVAGVLFLPGRALAVLALLASYLMAVILAAGADKLRNLPGMVYEAYLPVRAFLIRRGKAR